MPRHSSLPRLLPIAFLLVACGSSAAGSSGDSCGTLTGTYVETDTRDPSSPGDCAPTSSTPDTVTITDGGNGSAKVAFQGVTGACPATVNGCKLTADCMVSLTGGGTGTLQISFTLTETGYTGYVSLGETDTKGVKCTANYNVSATRKLPRPARTAGGLEIHDTHPRLTPGFELPRELRHDAPLTGRRGPAERRRVAGVLGCDPTDLWTPRRRGARSRAALDALRGKPRWPRRRAERASTDAPAGIGGPPA